MGNDFGNLLEICVNDDHLDVIKFVEKKEKAMRENEGIRDVFYTKRDSVSFAGYEMMDFEEFDSMKYVKENENDDDKFALESVNNVQFLSIIEFIYDHNNNHKRQCYNDDQNEYEFCLEFDESANEMLLYLDKMSEVVSFEKNDEWNEVHYVHINNDSAEGNGERIKKCVNLYHFDRKICVIKQKRQSQEDDDGEHEHKY